MNSPKPQYRALLRQLLESRLAGTRTYLREAELGRSAAVFAPHPDDETLGCGGTIAIKRRAGADVRVIFMTDGRRTNRRLMPEEQIKMIRKNEALAAAETLGVSQDRITFLDFKNGRLKAHCESARRRVTQILMERPEEVFIPYHGEPPVASDEHRLTNWILLSALRDCKAGSLVYEYPIWFWNHWPWVPIPRQRLRRRVNFILRSAGSSLALFQEFRCAVETRSVLEVKKAALHCHRSQMTKLVPDPKWKTLPEVGNGEFLQCFLRGYETFSRYQFSG